MLRNPDNQYSKVLGAVFRNPNRSPGSHKSGPPLFTICRWKGSRRQCSMSASKLLPCKGLGSPPQPLSPKHPHHIRGRLGSFLQKHRTCCVRKPVGPSRAPANRGAKPTLLKFKRPVEAHCPKQTCLPSSISIAHGCVLHNLMITWNSRKQKYSPPRIPTFPHRIAVPGCPWELAFKGEANDLMPPHCARTSTHSRHHDCMHDQACRDRSDDRDDFAVLVDGDKPWHC